MEPASGNDGRFVETSKRFARRLLTIGENRFQLLSGETPYLNPLESRKRLLIAESELNRAHLSEEWRTMQLAKPPQRYEPDHIRMSPLS